MLLKFCLSFLFLFCGGCMLLPSFPSASSSKGQEILNGNFKAVGADQLKSDLKRSSGAFNLHFYYVEVYPYTEALIRVEAEESSRKAMESPEESSKRLASHMDSMFKNNSCFMFFIATGSLESSKFNQWVAKTEDAGGKMQNLKFSNISGPDSVPNPNHDSIYPTWQNFSVACGPKVDFTKGLKVHVNNLLISDSPKTTLEWLIERKVQAGNSY